MFRSLPEQQFVRAFGQPWPGENQPGVHLNKVGSGCAKFERMAGFMDATARHNRDFREMISKHPHLMQRGFANGSADYGAVFIGNRAVDKKTIEAGGEGCLDVRKS